MSEPLPSSRPPEIPPLGTGKAYWRTLDELAQRPEFYEWMHREFPRGASQWQDSPNRREFLKIMAGSLAFAGLTACTRQPQEKILPYAKQPEELVLGIPLVYATAMTLGGYATGLLVESNEGRPTKIEGNPDHPASLGAVSIFHQASILDLYDPDRTNTVLRGGETSSWEEFVADLVPALGEQRAKGGAGLRILTGTVTSPTLTAQLEDVLRQYPGAVWHQYEPLHRDNVLEGARLAFGEALETDYDFAKASVVVALDADFLFTHPASLQYARQFANGRRPGDGSSGTMNRLYVAEPTPTITGSMADHRLPATAAQVGSIARDLAARVEKSTGPVTVPSAAAWLERAVQDLQANAGASIVLAGEGQPAAIHALAHRLNTSLGNVGKTVFYRSPVRARPGSDLASLRALADAMRGGQVELLVILGGNPVYDAPVDFAFGEAMGHVRRCVQLAMSYDETAAYCRWHVPQTHFLEGWSDARAFDGTISVGQPLIEPLYEGRTAHELLDVLLVQQNIRGSYDIVRDHWQRQQPASPAEFEKRWRKAVHDGLVAGSAAPRLASPALAAADQPPVSAGQTPDPGGLELVFRADGSVWDGRFANNGWLQELPKPMTKLTWDNAALVSPQLAKRLGLENEDVAELTFEGRSLHAPVWIMPGQAENSVTLSLGYGRTVGRVAAGQGVNAYKLRTAQSSYFGGGLTLKKVPGVSWRLATTQHQYTLDGRDQYRAGTLAEYRAHPDFAPKTSQNPKADETLYPPDHTYPGYAWGMSIDLSTCIGCNACVIACQSENNIPIVGKGEVINGRAMHWIRVDSYHEGQPENPALHHQPVPCMHCENAPCEVVCPVEATLHNPEGLNEQVYNRCIGTRYCSNNCPYKVRRFNFLQWADNTTLTYKLQRNPDVTVRSRGVMEKCTYCVQRINEAKITSQKEDRSVRDGEILTACQQTCPTEAIVFGNINDPQSRVSRLRAQPRNYGMLAELNTKPRTTYLAKITNPAAAA